MYDVARRAGVSHQTVSRVLNNHPNIRESTRSRVVQVIEEMNYTPSAVARALRSRRANHMGVLVDDVGRDGSSGNTLRALSDAARSVGYSVGVYSISDEESPQISAGVVELVARGVEALCVLSPRASLLDLLRQQVPNLPTILIQSEANSLWPSIGVDQRHGARSAVQHLLELGHRTVAHLAGPESSLDARERTEGWRSCVADAGAPKGPLIVGDGTSDFGFECGRFFDLGDATAIFAGNDHIALGVIHGLQSRGIRVPEDVSIAGFGDSPEARHFLPPLTTVRVDSQALGEAAFRRILAVVEGDAEPTHIMVRPQLTIRESTDRTGDVTE